VGAAPWQAGAADGRPSLSRFPGHERQAAEELGQWKHIIEERKVIDATPAAITLAMICTREREMLWFAQGSASYRRHFPPLRSPSKSAAATPGSSSSAARTWPPKQTATSVLDDRRAGGAAPR
jgi:hypothetical protein